MPHAKTRRRETGWAVLCLLVLNATSGWAASSVALTSGESLVSSELVAYDSQRGLRNATLRVDGANREVAGLVRWGEPAPIASRAAIVLTDGSRLLSDRTWSPAGLVLLRGDRVKLRRGGAWFEIPRRSVRWIVLDAAAAGLRLNDLPGDNTRDADQVWLSSGDRLPERVTALTSVELEGETTTTPLANVAAIRFAAAEDRPTDPACLVGLAGGSRLRADRVRIAEGRYTLELHGVTLTGEADELTLLQPLGGGVQYLSELEPADYQHTPYLDLAWPYTRDRGLRGGTLAGGGARRAKGLAMHSAARLIYRLDGSARRFRADLAVGDPPEGSAVRGSVVFRVYLVLDGAFAPAYESPTIRAGDPPTPVDLDLTGAAAIALVVDYADGGDAGDEALWLDARLVDME